MSIAAYIAAMHIDLEVDAIGLLCPLPVLRARKRLQGLQTGQVLCLIADDPAAIVDVPHFCAEAGHTLVLQQEHGNARHYFIRKG
ncbi:sulfurtransferase TusA family protein [Meridianimarinicoccus aquatilis]